MQPGPSWLTHSAGSRAWCRSRRQEAGGRPPVGIPFTEGARLHGPPPLGPVCDPTPVPLFLPRQGIWESPGFPRRGGGGRAPCRSRCARLQAAPRPRPFLPSPFCSGPFDWGTRPLYVALGLAGPPRPTHGWGFPFHLELGARGPEQDGGRDFLVSPILGDSAFSGALWPRSFDILSGNRQQRGGQGQWEGDAPCEAP